MDLVTCSSASFFACFWFVPFFKICFASFWCQLHTRSCSRVNVAGEVFGAFLLFWAKEGSLLLPLCAAIWRLAEGRKCFWNVDWESLGNWEAACLCLVFCYTLLWKKNPLILSSVCGGSDELCVCTFCLNTILLIICCHFKDSLSLQVKYWFEPRHISMELKKNLKPTNKKPKTVFADAWTTFKK